jgi:type II secretory pathway pseudopilin PulG
MIELLVAVVILGLLGGIVALTVGSLQDQARAGACAIERASLTAALESYRVGYGTYPTEAQLVSTGLLKSESATYDVTVQGDAYTLTPTGTCTGVDPTSTTTTSTTTTLPPTTTTTPSAR